MSTRLHIPDKPPAASAQRHMPSPFGSAQRECACGSSGSTGVECAECRKKRIASQHRASAQAGRKTSPGDAPEVLNSLRPTLHASSARSTESRAGHNFGKIRLFPAGQAEDTRSKANRTEEEGIVVVAQTGAGAGSKAGAATPDGDTLGPTDNTKRTCLGERSLIWVGGPDQNTATAATGKSRVTAHLGTSPGDGADCDCNCGLFRQFIRGFWRSGSPTAPKQFDIGSCNNTITMNESSWTEEHEACNPGGAPVSATCNRTYLDGPGFASGLSDGTFVELHLDLRYQMWDQCRGRPVATGDRRLRISGDRQPRNITFS
jgi:hypothetical protein